MKRTRFQRITAFLLCFSMLLPMLSGLPILTGSVEVNTNEDSETSTQITYLEGIHYYIEKSVSYIGNRSYQLNVKLHTTLTDTDLVLNRNYAQNGYFTVEVSGWYLLELWGGEGADGGDSTDLLLSRPGGDGGARGYVYAKVYLEKGQTLAYSVGTDGEKSELSGNGGINGAGGGHGDVGSQWVGGGGGYSALYFFDEGQFDPTWLSTGGVWNLPSSVRLYHYVMIAAGGGGGGAGNGTMWSNATGTGGIKLANGGAGGNISNGVSMTLPGTGNTVAGYLFFGKNGQSSGTSTAYVGRGGTNTPGISPSTATGSTTASPNPNNWSGAYNLDVSPGAGGSGMFRGGGGGAGFCGGSGGIMTGQAIASNVGGGGGGSSFLASAFGDSTVYFGTDVEQEKLHGANGCPSEEGGAFSCTYLGDDKEIELDTSYLHSVSVTGSFSKYFDVFTSPATDGAAANPNGELQYDDETGVFTVTGANIDASSVDREGTLLSLSFLLKAKSAFVGGNNVPLVGDISITINRGASEPTVIQSTPQDSTDFVNVPLSLSIPTHSKMISFKEGDEAQTFKIADLYINEHTAAISNPATAGWAYDFVQRITSPAIYTGNAGNVGSRYSATYTPAITETTYYSVCMTVTPKTDVGYAACGPRSTSSQLFYGVITITVLDATVFGGEDGWSYDLTANKTLSHDGTNFVFEQSVSQSLTRQYELSASAVYSSTGAQNGYSSSAFTVQKSGYYLLQAWGAKGGSGGSAYAQTPAGTSSATGGAGGAGAAVYVFAYLEEGDILHFTLGSTGGSGSNGRDVQTTEVNAAATGSGGTGGRPSAIALQKSGTTPDESAYVLIAGGGGGGAGSGAARGGSVSWNNDAASGASGLAGSGTFTYDGETPAIGSLGSFRGDSGTAGSADTGILINQGLVSASAGTRGSGGSSYCDAVYANVGKTDAQTLYLGRLAQTLAASSDFGKPTSSNAGAVRVSYICDDPTTEELEQFPGVEVSGSFSRYFEVATNGDGVPLIEMSIKGVTHDSKETTLNDDGSITVTYYKGDILMAQFSFTLSEENNITSYHVYGTVYHPTFRVSKTDANTYIADCGFSIQISLSPREGFLGGNDVPVLDGLDEDSDYTNVMVRKGDSEGYLRADDKADYANVAVNYDVAAHFAVKEGFTVLDDGDDTNDSVNTNDLYTLDIDLSEYAEWQKQFLTVLYPEEQTCSPSFYSSQTVALTAGLVPIAPPEKAVVIGDVDGARVTLYATVTAKYPIYYELDHLSVVGPQYVSYGETVSIRLACEEGFLLPDAENVRVLNRSGNSINFTYDEETGMLEIPNYTSYSPITVQAQARPRPYRLHYVFSIDGVNEEEVVEEYDAGAAISTAFLDTFLDVYGVERKEGYTFTWDWETEDGEMPLTMPGHDVWVVGGYKKDIHTLTILYVDESGAPVADAYSEVLEYGQSYSIPSPKPAGYMPEQATANGVSTDPVIISGVMGTEDITVTVVYSQQTNRLTILYLYPDGSEIARVDRTMPEGEAYQEFAPNVTGYVPNAATINGETWLDPTCVSGIMPAGDSLLVIVYYKAETYSVDLEYRYSGDTPYPLDYDLSGAVLDGASDTIAVQYDNIWGYNPETDTYGLPTPVAPGYAFAGWYTDAEFTNRVEEEDTVTLTVPAKLYAKWEPVQYKLIIRFNFVEGQYIAPDISVLPDGTLAKDGNADGIVDYYYLTVETAYEDYYDIAMGQMTGYTPYVEYGIPGGETEVDTITGQMPAMDQLYDVTYEINSYRIRFFAYGGLSHVSFPTYTAFAQEEGPFAEDVQLAEAVYEHAQPVVYPEESPDQMREYYTFVPDYWEDAAGARYPADKVATEDADFYAHYMAYENIAVLYASNGTDVLSYHYRLQDAADAAVAVGGTYLSDSPIIVLRRNEDVKEEDRAIQLSDTVIIGAEQNAGAYVRLNLNGIDLCSSKTAITVQHGTLYLYNQHEELQASVIVRSEEDAVAICQGDTGALVLGGTSSSYRYPVTVEATSRNGDAVGIYTAGQSASLTQYSGEILANAPEGNAFGILQEFSDDPGQNVYYLHIYGTINVAAGKEACAVRSNASAYINSAAELKASAIDGPAFGFDGTKRLDLSGAAGAAVYAFSENGAAVGLQTTYQIYLSVSTSADTTVRAESNNSNASAIVAKQPGGSLSGKLNAIAAAPNGKATTVHFDTGTSDLTVQYQVKLRAEGKEAVALSCNRACRVNATLEAIGTESAIALRNPGNQVTIAEGAQLLADSPSGEAYGICGGSLVAYSASITASVLATTVDGNAYALYDTTVTGTTASMDIHAEATGIGSAYGFYISNGNSGTLHQDAQVTADASVGTAYGAYIEGEATLYGSVAANGQQAYGVYVTGRVTEIGGTISVQAEQFSYGVAAVGGSVAAPQSGFAVNVNTPDGTAYGLYAASGGSIGGAPVDEAVNTGKITAATTGSGTGYALYAQTGNIYISGTNLYYKGTSDETRWGGDGVVICPGFAEYREDSDPNYLGYYYLKVEGEYQIIFVGFDLEGNEIIREYRDYIPGVGFETEGEPSAPTSTDAGYTGRWEDYDFSAPDEMDAVPDPNKTYYKEVRSCYDRNSFTVTYYFNDDSNSSITQTVTYLDEIPLPEMGDRVKLGYVFNGIWKRGDDGNDWIMPAGDLNINAQWDKDFFTVTVMTGGVDITFHGVEEIYRDDEMVKIRGEYQTYLDYTYVAPGYTLSGFYTNAEKTQKWTQGSIPAQDITIWAGWSESISAVIMGAPKEYKIAINIWLDTDGDGVEETIPFGSLEDLFGDDMNLSAGELSVVDISPLWLMTHLPEEIASQFGGTRLRIVGWYTPDGRPIKLASGVGSWGITPDADGYTQIYARLVAPESNVGVLKDMFIDEVGNLPIPRSTLIFNQHFNFLFLLESNAEQDGAAGGYTYHSYKALTTGTHVFYLAEAGTEGEGYFTQHQVTLCKQDGTKTVVLGGEEGKLEHVALNLNFDNEADYTRLEVDMEAGDTLLFRTNQMPNENGDLESGGTLLLVSLPGIPDALYDAMDPDGNNPTAVLQFYLIMHNAMDFFFYTGSMGQIQLPVGDPDDPNPAYQNVTEWIVADETMQPTDHTLTSITPDLLQDTSLWIDGGGMAIMFLLPKVTQEWSNAWSGAITSGRHFHSSALAGNTAVHTAMPDAGSVTFSFYTEKPTAGEEGMLIFANGLPAGTTLTLIDQSGEYPVYYYYRVSAQDTANGPMKTLPLSSFVCSGGSENFSGCAQKMMFQICYSATAAPDSESIRIRVGSETSALAFSFTRSEVKEISLGDRVAEDSGTIRETLTISSLTDRGYDEDDKVVLVLRLYDEEGALVSLPAGFLVEPVNGKLVTCDDFAFAVLGTVGDLSNAISLTGEMYLSTLRYLNFTGTVVYEVIVLPAGTDLSGASIRSADSAVDTRFTCSLTVKETPAVVLSESGAAVARGESFSVTVGVEGKQSADVQIYILRRDGGKMLCTGDCSRLLVADGTPVAIDGNGKMLGEFSTGKYTVTVSDEAETGIYYILVYHNNSYAVYTLTVTE